MHRPLVLAGVALGLLGSSGCGPARVVEGNRDAGVTLPDPDRWHYHLGFEQDFIGYDNLLCGWDSSRDRVLYLGRGRDQYYDLFTTDLEKRQTTCVTCDKPFLPNRHMGTAVFVPGGEFIVFVAERAVHEGGYCHEPWCGSYAALPGYGAYNDVWIIRTDGSQAWQLTHYPQSYSTGMIIPVISHDGKKLLWTNHRDGVNPFATDWHFWGNWEIEVADLVWSGGALGVGEPSVANLRKFQANIGFNEGSSFSKDDKRIFFSSANPRAPLDVQLYSIDVETLSDLRQLTDNTEFNEHPVVMPNGEQLVFMSGRDSSNDSEIWIMNVDGTGQQRLSYVNEPWHPQWTGAPRLTGGTGVASTDTTYPARFMNLQFPGPLEYRGLIKRGVISRRKGGEGTGLRGEYFAGSGWAGAPVVTRVDPELNFYWKDGEAGRQPSSPAPGQLSPDSFSVRWTGQLETYSDVGGSYTFRCVYDDTCRVWIDDRQIIDAPWWWPGRVDGSVALAAGTRYRIRVEMSETGVDAQLRLAWKSADFDWEVVPRSQLTPPP